MISFPPFTNAFGLVGDQISYARRSAAIRAASAASAQLKEEGITRADIPPKVLLPWLEGASLETDEQENLTQAWAGLFVRAAKSPDAVTVSYIETLKRLGKEEASLLEFFATDTSPVYSSIFYDPSRVDVFSEDNPLRINFLSKLDDAIQSGITIGNLQKRMENLGIQGMCQVIFFSLNEHRMVPTDFFDKHQHAISNLEHLRLIDVKSCDFDLKSGNLTVVWFQITKYAFDLIWACQGTLTGQQASGKQKSSASKPHEP